MFYTPYFNVQICTNTKGEKYCDDAYAKGYCERADKWREMRMGCAAKCDFCNDPSPPPLSYDHSSTTHEDRHEKVCANSRQLCEDRDINVFSEHPYRCELLRPLKLF